MGKKTWRVSFLHCPKCSNQLELFKGNHFTRKPESGDQVRCPRCNWKGLVKEKPGAPGVKGLRLVETKIRKARKPKEKKEVEKK